MQLIRFTAIGATKALIAGGVAIKVDSKEVTVVGQNTNTRICTLQFML